MCIINFTAARSAFIALALDTDTALLALVANLVSIALYFA